MTLPAPSSPAAAAAALYERHYRRIHGYCLYRLRHPEEAEDAAQTTFLYAVRALRRGVVPNSEVSWLLAIAHNTCLARFRQRGRRRDAEVLSDPQALDSVVARVTEPDDLLELEEALGELPEQQRRAFVLRELRGLSYAEVAVEMGVTVASVEMLIFRARRTLAATLQAAEPSRGGRLARHGFDLGSLVAAVKSALGWGTTAKVAAGAAAVVTATTLALAPPAGPEDSPLPRPPAHADEMQPRHQAAAAGRESNATHARRRAAAERAPAAEPVAGGATRSPGGAQASSGTVAPDAAVTAKVPEPPEVEVVADVPGRATGAAGGTAAVTVSLP